MKRNTKFQLGEEVAVRSRYYPQYDQDRTKIVKVIHNGDETFYKVEGQPDMRYVYYEESIHKLPKEDN